MGARDLALSIGRQRGRQRRPCHKSGGGGDGGGGKRRREAPQVEERTGPRQFAREVRSELRKVSWPTRAEVINYSLVVFFTVVVLTVLIGILDWAFSSSLLKLFET